MAPVSTVEETLECLATKLDGMADGNLGQELRQLLQDETGTLDDIDPPSLSKDHVQFRLAPQFGVLEEESMQKMDKALRTWYHELVKDIDVIEATTKTMDEVQESVHKPPKSKETRKFLDVGVLRFPDISRPYIQAYHIQLFVHTEAPQGFSFFNWIKRSKDAQWIEGEYNSRKFKPRDDMIKRLDPGLVDQAVAKMEARVKSFINAGRMSLPT